MVAYARFLVLYIILNNIHFYFDIINIVFNFVA